LAVARRKANTTQPENRRLEITLQPNTSEVVRAPR